MTESRQRSAQATLLSAVFGTAILLGFAITSLKISIEALLVLATALVVAAPVVRRFVEGTFDLFEPMTAFFLVYMVIFVIRPAYMFANDADYFQIANEVAYIGDSMVKMQVGALLGAVGFVFAYEFGPGVALGSVISSRRSVGARRIALGGLALLVLGFLGTLMYVSAVPGGFQTILAGRTASLNQSVSATSGYLFFAPTLLVPASLLLMVAWLKSKRLSHLVLALVAAAMLVAVRGPVGGRITLLPLFGGAIVFLYLWRGSRPKLSTIAIFLVVGMFLWTLIGEVRNQDTRTAEGTRGVASRLIDSPSDLLEPITKGQDAAMAPGLAAGMTVIPSQIPYFRGTGILGDVAVRGIPRSVWPNKPLPPREQLINVLWGGGYAKNIANPEPSVLFSWYAELGLIGIVLGMALFGTLFRAAWQYLNRYRSNVLVVLTYSIFLASVPIILREGVTDSVVKVGFTVFPVIAVACLGVRKVRASRESSGVP